MKYTLKSADVLDFEMMWNDLEIGEFHLMPREIDFVNEMTTISIPEEYVMFLPA